MRASLLTHRAGVCLRNIRVELFVQLRWRWPASHRSCV